MAEVVLKNLYVQTESKAQDPKEWFEVIEQLSCFLCPKDSADQKKSWNNIEHTDHRTYEPRVDTRREISHPGSLLLEPSWGESSKAKVQGCMNQIWWYKL